MKTIVVLLLALYIGVTNQLYCQDQVKHSQDDTKQAVLTNKDTVRVALLKSKAEKCMNNIIRLDFKTASELFDPRFKEDFSPDTLKKFWAIFNEEAGAVIEQTGIKDETDDSSLSVILTYLCKKGRWDIHLVFTDSNQISGLYVKKTPPPLLTQYLFPDYVAGDSVREIDITVGKGEWTVPGHITLPAYPGKYPAIVLVHGSGPMDRDGMLFSSKPYKDLAWGLASQGIAVLRYDKRTKFHSKKILKTRPLLTTEFEVAEDVLSALKILEASRDVRHDKIFVMGHGLGGMLAPKIAKQDSAVAGLIILAGNSRPLEDLILEQVEYVYSLDGIVNDDRTKIIKKLKRMVQNVKSPTLSNATPDDSLPLQVPAAYWLGLKGYNPAQTAAKLNKPMLILQGERDYEVTMDDFELWKKALKNDKMYQFKSYPNLNHIFVSGKGKARPDEYRTPSHVDREIIDDIARWVTAQTGK